MLPRLIHHLLLTMGILGFFLQTLAGGVEIARSLCVGCEGIGWRVSESQQPLEFTQCCADGEPAGLTDAEHLSARSNGDDCSCVRVLLPAKASPTAPDSRAHIPSHEAMPIQAVMASPSFSPDCLNFGLTGRRSEPEYPPRLLSPQSRATVLMI